MGDLFLLYKTYKDYENSDTIIVYKFNINTDKNDEIYRDKKLLLNL